MSEYFGRVPSLDVLARMGEIDATFSQKKLGETPEDVQSFAWGFQQSTAQGALKELSVGDFPNLITQFNSTSNQTNQSNDGNTYNIEGGGGGSDMSCGDVCRCIADGCTQATDGACCYPEGGCSTQTPSDCALTGGVFMGFGVLCTNINCAGPPPPGGGGGGGTDTSEDEESSSIDWSSATSEEPNDDGGGPGQDPGVDPGIKDPKPPVIPPIIVDPIGPGPTDGPDPGDEDCITRNQGGKIIMDEDLQPHPDEVRGCCCGGTTDPNGTIEPCSIECKHLCFGCCVPPNKRPKCHNVPVKTIILCPCGPNKEYGEPDKSPLDPRPQPNWGPPPVPAEKLPDGSWEFSIPSVCCCTGQHPPDTDGDGIISSGIVDPEPNEFNTWPVGEVCIIVDWERRCSTPEPPGGDWHDVPEDCPCEDICLDGLDRCYQLYNGVVAQKQTYKCKPCCGGG